MSINLRMPKFADEGRVGNFVLRGYKDQAILFYEPRAQKGWDDQKLEEFMTVEELRDFAIVCMVIANEIEKRVKDGAQS